MAKVIAINAGSSSLKFQLFEMEDESVIASGVIERIGLEDSIFTINFNNKKEKVNKHISNHKQAVDMLLSTLIEMNVVDSLDEIKGVGHRVVHGGEYFNNSIEIDDYVANKIAELSNLAPLHNPANLVGYEAFKDAMPSARAVAVFDTAFHQTMAPKAYIYPIPYEYYNDLKIRKYGAHGTSHFYVSRRLLDLLGNPKESKLIVCHLGAGGSLAAIKNGKSINTSMGFTPLAGIMMGTRCGDLDPSIISYLVDKTGYNINKIIDILNTKSGLLGVSGISSDFRDIEKAANDGNERAKLAMDIYYRRITDFIGRYFIQLGGIDAIAFTAGIGENSYSARTAIVNLIKDALDIELDEKINRNVSHEALISTPDSKVKLYVIPTNEELVIARDVKRILEL